MRLTAVTIAKNEEAHIGRALRGVQGLADEIVVVVDAETTDRTEEIARRFTDTVFRRSWDGYGPQKNFALDRAAGDWVLFLDADEAVPPDLAAEIRRVVDGSSTRHLGSRISVYFLRIITVFLGKPLRHLWGTNPRLLRRGAVRWDSRKIHEQAVRTDDSTVRLGDPDTALLTAPLLHPSHYDTLAAYLEKRERYTTRDAEDVLATGRDRLGKRVPPVLRSSFSLLLFLYGRALKQFVRLFVKKRGFLDGWEGWLWCWLSAEYEVMVSKKYLALVREQRQKNEERRTK